MRVESIGLTNQIKQKITVKNKGYQTTICDSVNFTGLLPNEAKKLIKLCVYDLDETLLEGSQALRNKILEFSKGRYHSAHQACFAGKGRLPSAAQKGQEAQIFKGKERLNDA